MSKEKDTISNANASWRVFKRIYKKMKVGDTIGFSIKRKHFIIKRNK